MREGAGRHSLPQHFCLPAATDKIGTAQRIPRFCRATTSPQLLLIINFFSICLFWNRKTIEFEWPLNINILHICLRTIMSLSTPGPCLCFVREK